MAKTDFESVTEYLATLPSATRTKLQRVRSTIRKTIPQGEETISYQIPAVKLEGRVVIYFAGWKEHYSVYPATEKVRVSLARELTGYEVSKGTIRFPLSEPVPVALIARIAAIRAQETVLLVAARRAKRGKLSTSKPSKQVTSKKKRKAKLSSSAGIDPARRRKKEARPRGKG
jgi:uncharacterized protein YdhG (YjbR/CyaY superfamily)